MAQKSSGTSTRRTGMNLMESALATILEWLLWNCGQIWKQTTRKTPKIVGTFVGSAVVASRDLKGPRSNRDQEVSSKNLSSSSVRTRAVTSWSYRVILLVAIEAVKLGLAEGTLLCDLPSGLKCAWYNLSHPAQCAALIMTLGCIYGVNRLFDKLDSAMYARLSRATRNWMQQRREALGM
ncbi:unnamed protein product [Ectocarpus sp. CCAP 1310/34]|nr:unnamed protein product [Ectocarpus sp. CCAP 1310/34]